MKNKSFFEKFKNSIYNIREFPQYIREGVGKAILYALILSIIVGGIKGITTTFTLSNDINLAIQTLEDDKYKFKIENGTLDLVTSPLKIENGNTLIYLDDNMDISQSEELKNITVHLDSYILILKDGIVTNSEVMLGFSQAKYGDFLGGMIITNDNIIETKNQNDLNDLIWNRRVAVLFPDTKDDGSSLLTKRFEIMEFTVKEN